MKNVHDALGAYRTALLNANVAKQLLDTRIAEAKAAAQGVRRFTGDAVEFDVLGWNDSPPVGEWLSHNDLVVIPAAKARAKVAA